MQGGRRQHGGDGNLTVGYIPMQLVPTPVMVISMAVALASQIALPRQIGQHFRQFHAPLPLQTRVGFGLIGPFAAKVSRIRTWLTPATAGGLRHRFCCRCLGRRFGVAFAGFYRRGIACNVTDQAIFLSFPNQRLMHKLWQFHACELVEGSRKSRSVPHLRGLFPAADAAQLWVAREVILMSL